MNFVKIETLDVIDLTSLIGEKDTGVILKNGRIVRIWDYNFKTGNMKVEYIDRLLN